MTEAEDFLGTLTDPKGYGIKKAVAALNKEHADIVDIKLSLEFDDFKHEDVWIVDITGTNVDMFNQQELQQRLEYHVYKYTDYWIVSSLTPRYISNLNDGLRDGYCAQQFNIMNKIKLR